MSDANPNGPRARVVAELRRVRAAILNLLETQGPLTNVQMCEQLGYEVVATRSRLCRMASEGLIHSELIDGVNSPHMALYYFGPGESTNTKAEMRQRTVHKWKPQKITIDPLHAALFGQRT